MRRRRERGQSAVIELRRAQLSFGDGLIAGEVKDLRESWMNHADRLLDDETIVAPVYEALGRRRPQEPQSRSSWRAGRDGAAPLDPQACPQLELRGSRARGARQLGLPRLHAGRRRQDAGRQDNGSLGLGGWAGGDQACSRAARCHREGRGHCGRPADASRHDGRRDQHPLSDRTRACSATACAC